jgi:hypothetical protein
VGSNRLTRVVKWLRWPALVAVVLLSLTDSLLEREKAEAISSRYSFVRAESQLGVRMKPSRTWGSTFVDYNRDGWADLLVNRHLRHPKLYGNLGGSLRLVPRGRTDMGRPPRGRNYYDRHSCAWGEANGDGRLDLYCASGAQKGTGTGPNQLLLQQADGRLVDVASRWGVVDLYGRGRTVNWFDYDSDGRLDLYVGNAYRQDHPNRLFRNMGREFVSVDTDLPTYMHTGASSWSDWNNDGRPDLLVLSESAGESGAYVNKPSGFTKVDIPGLTGQPWMSGSWGDFDGDGWTDLALIAREWLTVMRNDHGDLKQAYGTRITNGRVAAWADVDNDGDLDLFVVQGSPGEPAGINAREVLVVQRNGTFVPGRAENLRGPVGGNGDSVSIADVNHDGRLDFAVTNGFGDGRDEEATRGETTLLINESPAGNWVELRLFGTAWNPLGYGARIRVRTRDLNYRREITDGVAFKSQVDVSSVHLGLGTNDRAMATITWPTGERDCLRVRSDRIVKVEIGQHPCRAS